MMLNNKKAVFFDLDHTLWDFEKNSALAIAHVFSNNDVAVSVDDFLHYYVDININYWKKYRDNHITQQQLRYGRLKDTFDILGYNISDEVIYKLSEEYIEALPLNNFLYDGTIEVLDYLKGKYSLHIITNGFHAVQQGKLKNSKIDHYFKTVTNSENAGCKKPHPDIFEFAVKTAGVEKCDSIMIGDCIEADVQGALDCGIDAIYFNEHKKETPNAIVQINHLLELKNIL